MSRWFVIVLTVFAVVPLGTTRAQPPYLNSASVMASAPAPPPEAIPAPGFTLEDLEQMAMSGNPTLAQAQSRIAAAQGRAAQAGLYPNPRLEYVGDEMGGGTAGFQGGSIIQEVVTGGKRRLDVAIANSDTNVMQQEFAAQTRRVTNDVRIEFYNVLAAQRSIDLAGEILNVGEQGVKSSEQLYKAKQVALTDVLQAQVERDTAGLVLDAARNRHTSAWRRLAAVVGRNDLAPAPLRGDLAAGIQEIRWEDALQYLRSQSPEVSAAVMAKERAEYTLARAQREPIPNVELSLGFQHDNTGTGNDVTNVRAGVPLPLWNRNQGSISAASAEVRTAEADITRVELSLQNRLAGVYERFANARAQHEKFTRTILPNAKSVLDLATKGYQQGEFSYLQLLTAQRTYFQTNLDAISALRELRESSTLIDGLLLNESLGGGMKGGESTVPAAPVLRSGARM